MLCSKSSLACRKREVCPYANSATESVRTDRPWCEGESSWKPLTLCSSVDRSRSTDPFWHPAWPNPTILSPARSGDRLPARANFDGKGLTWSAGEFEFDTLIRQTRSSFCSFTRERATPEERGVSCVERLKHQPKTMSARLSVVESR